MKLHLKEGYRTAMIGICEVPVHMEKGFAEEVKNMVSEGIIRWMRHGEHSEWVISYVLVARKVPDDMPENMVSAEKVGSTDIPCKRICSRNVWTRLPVG